ncbi:hypothetical protein [Phaeobacter sp. J2-8]|uniref:hypothetical protein n=1 Tax=Phaeobacter sp. J2-8 TaxID=2931394 RepID=UPI001FD00F99|nr:hypothetical protein [Phaeobacter sp. J2-8]MCJ7871496.1 hypothetical protein [Phaeobacter sp. J2-8]
MDFADLRFTVSEVAALTETNLNTVQGWRRKGFFDLGDGEGWHRFTMTELFSIAVFAEVSGWTGNQDVASSSCSLADQMLTEIIEDGAAPYFVGAGRNGTVSAMEVTYGIDDVGRVLSGLLVTGVDAGAYIVVDYSAIFQRLFERLHKAGYTVNKNGEDN